MVEKEAEAQKITEAYLLGKYGEDGRSVYADANWAKGHYEQDKERY